MNYTSRHYAEALLDLTVGQPDSDIPAITKKFVGLLTKHRALSRYQDIIRYFSQLYNAKQGTHDIQITSAKPLSQAQRGIVIRSLPPSESISYRIEPLLIGGLQILIDNEQLIDGSLRNRIDQLFRNL